MRILRLLNKKYLKIILILFITIKSYAEDKPVDIWNIQEKNKTGNLNIIEPLDNSEKKIEPSSSIYEMQTNKNLDVIMLDEKIENDHIKIVGLYDPEDYGLDINMWMNSDGDQLKSIFSKLKKMDLSEDAKEILNISILINAHKPTNKINEKEFMKFKSDWLIKDSNFDLIEKYLIQNQALNIHPELTKYLINYYLSEANIEKSCEIFSKNLEPIKDEYLSKFNIYCLIVRNKKEEAQINLDLKKELGFEDKYFENKINFLLGFENKIDDKISQESILNFHLAHITNSEFNFEPNDKTDKLIWKYLSSSNLLSSLKKLMLLKSIRFNFEKAVHNKIIWKKIYWNYIKVSLTLINF